jgi:hypothetical protein
MTRLFSVAALAFGMLGLGILTLSAQEPAHTNAITYQCIDGTHCSITCSVDGEKVTQTGNPKTVTVTPLGRNNYLVDFTEQGGHTQSTYLAGTKVACILDGLTTKTDK